MAEGRGTQASVQERETVEELEKRVSSINDVTTLRAELEGETRRTARDAIEGRISEIAPAARVEDDGSLYTREELMDGAAGFGSTPEAVAGALRLAGKTTMTRTEAAEAIRAFEGREI